MTPWRINLMFYLFAGFSMGFVVGGIGIGAFALWLRRRGHG